jgi:hypothetical protein
MQLYAKYILELKHENEEKERMEFILTPPKLTLFEVLLAEGWEIVETIEERL